MAETIAQAIEQIKNTVSLRSLDESATKQGVALRLLSLAGWNPFDVSEVVPEYTVGNRRVDYALRPGSAIAVFIEVKRPGENLERHQQPLLEHCFQEGVKLAALTNGRTWWLYLPLQAGSWEQRRFLTIDLESQEPNIVEQRFMGWESAILTEEIALGIIGPVQPVRQLVLGLHPVGITGCRHQRPEPPGA